MFVVPLVARHPAYIYDDLSPEQVDDLARAYEEGAHGVDSHRENAFRHEAARDLAEEIDAEGYHSTSEYADAVDLNDRVIASCETYGLTPVPVERADDIARRADALLDPMNTDPVARIRQKLDNIATQEPPTTGRDLI